MSTNNVINTSSPISVASGGTGASTLLSHGVLIGEGTGTITAIAVGGNNSILMGNTSADPAFTTSGTPYVSGISFDSGSNILSSYVDKTSWTPTIAFGGGSTGVTYTSQLGTYIRIGNCIFFDVLLTLSNKGSSTGTATIGGLPFEANLDNVYTFSPLINSLTFTQNYIVCVVTTSPTKSIRLTAVSSASTSTDMADTNFANTTGIRGSGFYFI